jgi:hypothetical protein
MSRDTGRIAVGATSAARRSTALIICPHGWSIRNYLRSDFLDRLATSCALAVALGSRDDSLAAEFEARCHVLELPVADARRTTRVLELLVNMAHEHRNPQEVVRARRANLLKAGGAGGRGGRAVLDRIAWVVSRTCFSGTARFESWLATRNLRGGEAERLLAETRPDVVFSTGPSLRSDAAVVRLARSAGIPTAAAILSWDNPSTKSRMLVPFDRYFVWSEAMAGDLVHYYPEVDRGRVSVTGTPQFDFHVRPGGLSREQLCQALDLDPARPIIAYTSSTARLLPGEEWIVERLVDALVAGRIPGAPQLLVRLHPYDDGGRFDAVRRRGVCVARPWEFCAAEPSWSHPNPRDMEILIATLRHAAVNVNFFSTMTLDFALCDTPVVNVAIETPASRAAGVDVGLFYHYEHYRPVLEERAVRLARTIEEMVEQVSAYLRDPSLDRDGRRRLVQRVCGPTDGRAAERIADEVAGMAAGARR